MKSTPIKRRTPLKAKSELKRSGRIKARRKDKREREAYIRKHYGSEERLHRIKATPCCVCGGLPSENSHIRAGGMGTKASWRWIVPMCGAHHDEYHDTGRHTFAKKYAVNLDEIANKLAQEVKP